MKSILIVEEDEDICEIYKLLFESISLEVRNNIKDLEDCLNSCNADLIILDEWTCGRSYLTILGLCCKGGKGKCVPVIFCSTNPKMKNAAESFGAVFLEKPFDLGCLEDLVARFVL